MMIRSSTLLASLVWGIYLPTYPTPEVRPIRPSDPVDISELWVAPIDIAQQDLF